MLYIHCQSYNILCGLYRFSYLGVTQCIVYTLLFMAVIWDFFWLLSNTMSNYHTLLGAYIVVCGRYMIFCMTLTYSYIPELYLSFTKLVDKLLYMAVIYSLHGCYLLILLSHYILKICCYIWHSWCFYGYNMLLCLIVTQCFVHVLLLYMVDILFDIYLLFITLSQEQSIPDSKVHGANMGSTWVLSALDGPHVGPMDLVIRDHSVFLIVLINLYIHNLLLSFRWVPGSAIFCTAFP